MKWSGSLNAAYLNREKIFLVAIFASIACSLVIKSWMTLTVIFLSLISLGSVVANPGKYCYAKSSSFWLALISLSTPFIAEFICQVSRQSLVLRSLDGPLRGALCASIFLFLSTVDSRKLLLALAFGSLFGVFAVFVSITLFPEQYWGERAATYFVDPITLPCYTVMMLGILLPSPLGVPRHYGVVLKTFAVCATLYIAIQSGSRSAWLALIGLAIVMAFYVSEKSIVKLFFGLITIAFVSFGLYSLSDIVRERCDILFEALYYLIKFILPGFDDYEGLREILARTSTGHRVLIFMIDYELVKLFPLFGIADGALPSYETLQSSIQFLTPQIYSIRELSGSHSEFSALLVRRGGIFGALSLWALFGYPLYLALKLVRSHQGESRSIGWLMLFALTPIFCSAFGIQVFNLKMTISSYALVCAILMAVAFKSSENK